jgi:hypothetical protein
LAEQEIFPFPEYADDVDMIMAHYDALKQQLIRQMAVLAELPESKSNLELLQRQQFILAQITAAYAQFQTNVVTLLIPLLILNAYLSGMALSRFEVGEYVDSIQAMTPIEKQKTIDKIKKAIDVKSVSFKSTHDYKVHKLVTDTQRDILQATNNTQENVKSLVRQTVAKAMTSRGGLNYGHLEYEREMKKELQKQALLKKLDESEIAIIDKAGRRWKMEVYLRLVSKTKLMVTHLEAIKAEGAVNGVDLGIISTHPLTTDACTKYQGMIVSLNGSTAGFPSIDTVRRSGEIFHPNCRHFVRPVRNLRMVPPRQLEIHKKQLAAYNREQSN